MFNFISKSLLIFCVHTNVPVDKAVTVCCR